MVVEQELDRAEDAVHCVWSDGVHIHRDKFPADAGQGQDLMADRADIEAKLAEAQSMLEALEGGQLHIGHPSEGRTDAKMYDLRRQIAEYQAILDTSNA